MGTVRMNFVTEYGKGVHNFFTFQWLLCLQNCRAAVRRRGRKRLRAIGRAAGTRVIKPRSSRRWQLALKFLSRPRHWVARPHCLSPFRMRRLLKKLVSTLWNQASCYALVFDPDPSSSSFQRSSRGEHRGFVGLPTTASSVWFSIDFHNFRALRVSQGGEKGVVLSSPRHSYNT